ncbi:hypothetical protein GC167_06075 [bacterium]|nr:hypothetical protein [bacterium]
MVLWVGMRAQTPDSLQSLPTNPDPETSEWAEGQSESETRSQAQTNPVPEGGTGSEPEVHSPRRAMLYSTLLPGWGQIYNGKVWKAPLAWALIGTPVGFAVFNQQQYRAFSDAYIAAVDNNPETVNPYEGIYTPEQLITLQTTYRRWRDLSIILAVTAYALNILDAYVDGHLYYFDVSDDLSLTIDPVLMPVATGGGSVPGVGISLSWP